MKLETWIDTISDCEDQNLLKQYKIDSSLDFELNDDQKLILESSIEDKLISLIVDSKRENNGGGTEVKRLPRDYASLSNAEESVAELGYSKFNPNNLPYGIWWRDIYLPTFHPLPFPEIQNSIAASLALLNCNAYYSVKGKSRSYLPVVYCLGLQGSGKTELAKQVSLQYPESLRFLSLVSDTGASLKEALDARFADGDPGIAILDNFNPDKSIPRMGHHYDIVLANNKELAISRVSASGDSDKSKGGKGEYRTYCYKWLTSVFDPDFASQIEVKEMGRRLMTISFQPSKQSESHFAYDWSEFESEYYKFWTDYDHLKENYFPILRELAQMKPTMIDLPDPSFWQTAQMPIATGVAAGIWNNIWEAKEHIEFYWKMVPKMKRSSVKDLFTMLVDSFCTQHYPKLVRANNRPDNPTENHLDENIIHLNSIKQWINSQGVSVGNRDVRDVLPRLLSEYGYIAQKSDDGIIFVRNEI